MPKNLSLLFLVTLFLASCSSVVKERAVEQVKQVIKVKNIEDATAEMDALIKKTLSSPKETREYLSTDLFIKGNDAALRGDSATAAFLFKYVHKLNPKDLYVKKKLAIELIRIGELEDSKNLLKEIFVSEKFKEESTGLILGGVYTALDNGSKALSTYEKVVKHNPKSEEACVFLGKAYALEERFKKSLNLLGRCEKRMPKNGIFSYYKGKINLSQDKRKLAMINFRLSLKKDASFYQSAVALGLLYEEREKFSKAKKTYERFLEKNPMSYAVLTRIVQLLFATEDYKNIIDYAQKLSSLDSNDLNLKVRLGILYTDKQRFDDAKGIFREVLVAMPESDKVLYYLGSLYLQTEDYDNALTYFNKIDSESTLFYDSHLQMAQILSVMATENEEKAERFKSFVMSKSGKYENLKVELKVLLAAFYEDQKDYEGAITLLKEVKGLKAYTENHDYYLASLYEKLDNFKEARSVIMALLEKNPNNAHALNFLGYSLLEKNENLEQALVYIKKAVELKPEDGFIRDSLGWYYYKTGQYELALVEITKARESVKTDVVITKHLAIVYQELQRYNEAKKYYNEALKLCKIQSEKDDVIKAISDLESMRLPASQK